MQGQIFGKSPENRWYIDGKSPEVFPNIWF
jgi:hypothetical protein